MPSFAKPVWSEEGPGPTAVSDPGYGKAAGAIQALACDPTTPIESLWAPLEVGSG